MAVTPRCWCCSTAPLHQDIPVSVTNTPLDHFALTIDLADYAAWRRRLEALGLDVLAKEQRGFFWRSLFFDDPEGNVVELVCYDESVPDAE